MYEIRAFWEDARASTNPDCKPDLRYHATRRLETFVMQRADAVTVICEGLARDVIARGIPTEKVTIIPNAVDRNAFSGRGSPDPDLARKLGLAGRTVIGFFGSFYFYEGLHLLLRAVPELRRRDPEIAVLLAGGGPEEANLRKLAADLGLESAVIFAGRVPHSDIQRYYDLADLLVFPRLSMRLTELVTPLKPLEAMAQERIVVASDVGGHRELIRDRETGYLFPPGDPRHVAEGIFAALDDRASWQRVQARALQYVETERSWAHSVARYAPVYDRLMRGRQRRRGDAQPKAIGPKSLGRILPEQTALRIHLPEIHLIAAARPNFMKIAPLFHQLQDGELGAPGADPYRPALRPADVGRVLARAGVALSRPASRRRFRDACRADRRRHAGL